MEHEPTLSLFASVKQSPNMRTPKVFPTKASTPLLIADEET